MHAVSSPTTVRKHLLHDGPRQRGSVGTNNTGYSINTAVVAWENRTYSNIVHIVRFGLDIRLLKFLACAVRNTCRCLPFADSLSPFTCATFTSSHRRGAICYDPRWLLGASENAKRRRASWHELKTISLMSIVQGGGVIADFTFSICSFAQVNAPALSSDDRFIFMPWQINQGPVQLLSFDASTYQLLSNVTAGHLVQRISISARFLRSSTLQRPPVRNVRTFS